MLFFKYSKLNYLLHYSGDFFPMFLFARFIDFALVNLSLQIFLRFLFITKEGNANGPHSLIKAS